MQRPGACTYLGIVENDEYAIAAFIFAPGAKIPLHDHPRDDGAPRVVRGSLRVTSFDVGADGKARRSISLMTSADGPAALFPSVNNVHEFQAGAGGAVYWTSSCRPTTRMRDGPATRVVDVGGGVFELRGDSEPADFECARRRLSLGCGHGSNFCVHSSPHARTCPKQREQLARLDKGTNELRAAKIAPARANSRAGTSGKILEKRRRHFSLAPRV